MKKKRGPQDLTLRNLHATKRLFQRLEHLIARMSGQINQINRRFTALERRAFRKKRS